MGRNVFKPLHAGGIFTWYLDAGYDVVFRNDHQQGASCLSRATGCYRLATVDWRSKIFQEKQDILWNIDTTLKFSTQLSMFTLIMLQDNSLKVESRLPLQKSRNYFFSPNSLSPGWNLRSGTVTSSKPKWGRYNDSHVFGYYSRVFNNPNDKYCLSRQLLDFWAWQSWSMHPWPI